MPLQCDWNVSEFVKELQLRNFHSFLSPLNCWHLLLHHNREIQNSNNELNQRHFHRFQYSEENGNLGIQHDWNTNNLLNVPCLWNLDRLQYLRIQGDLPRRHQLGLSTTLSMKHTWDTSQEPCVAHLLVEIAHKHALCDGDEEVPAFKRGSSSGTHKPRTWRAC